MLGIGADYPDHALAVDHLALVANLFNGSSNFHKGLKIWAANEHK